jgi:transaldolase
MTSRTQRLTDEGVSIWLDDLSRDRMTSGGLQKLIDERNVVGVTTNPTIFAKALAGTDAYDAQITELAAHGADLSETIFELTTSDVAQAADIFRPVFDATGGKDGRVSIEVQPALAHDTEGTVAEAKRLWAKVDRPNLMIKIPATEEGIGAIAAATAAGISVNITLIFSLKRYRQVINAYLTGLEQARAAGIDIAGIWSVASFFVSRVDVEVDKRLEAVGSPEALVLKGKAGIANARLAYQIFEEAFTSERARTLLAAGAHIQRPLWASTGTKDPTLPDTLYITSLVARDTVNTIPEKTLEATFDHGEITGDTITSGYSEANATLDAISDLGISYDEVTRLLEDEGVEKFDVSWSQLQSTVSGALETAVQH